MKILATILIILGLFKESLALNLEVSDLYPLSHAYGLDSKKVYNYLYGFLVSDGIISIISGIFMLS